MFHALYLATEVRSDIISSSDWLQVKMQAGLNTIKLKY